MTNPEIRPPEPLEMPAYYRALPFANGLPSWEPANAAWHGGTEPWPPPRPPATEEQLQAWAVADIDNKLFHPMAVFVDGVCVAGSATITFEVTVPGGGSLPMAGVTATGVLATHRRRGYLRHLMQALLTSSLERGEPLAMLSASEGGIYGRFGFSPATYRTRWEVSRTDVSWLPAPPDSGALELVVARTAQEVWPLVHAKVRAMRAGELTPLAGRWDQLSDISDGTNGPLRYLVHRSPGGEVDGIANFRLPWSSDEAAAGTLIVEALEATTPEAYRALWGLLLDFDLTRTVVAPGRPLNEPLTWMLRNPRAIRVTRQSDNLWARLLDVPAALARRAFVTADRVVLAVRDDAICPGNVDSWEIDTHGSAAICSRTRQPPDAVISIGALSSLYFGGVSAHQLAYAGQISDAAPATVRRIHQLFRWDPPAHNSFGF